jgi:hypothetical protein
MWLKAAASLDGSALAKEPLDHRRDARRDAHRARALLRCSGIGTARRPEPPSGTPCSRQRARRDRQPPDMPPGANPFWAAVVLTVSDDAAKRGVEARAPKS